MATKEQQTQKQVLDFLEASGMMAWRNFNGPIYTSRGLRPNPAKSTPDILGIGPCGVTLGFEIKENEKSKRSDGQVEWIENARARGALAMFVWDLDQVVQLLKPCHDCPGQFACDIDLDLMS